MSEKEVELRGQICPFPVMHIIQDVDQMRPGEMLRFLVDDPLAIKSVPEELEEYADISFSIRRQGRYWEIVISREGEKDLKTGESSPVE
ncbi:MAG: sulfurtransferase TusA family protein [Candidatus Aegiribacteria sp.]|nr:sulfurtransferase TusA family protein [Candidatus Aegiribacteria sp.]